MWKSEYMTGIKFIDEQHRQLHDLSSVISRCALAGNKEEAMKRLDDFFYYLMFHFEYENKLMQSREYPMYYDHNMAHGSILSEILAGMELSVVNFDEGIELLTSTFEVFYEKHFKEFDQKLSEFERQSLPQKLEDYYHVANGQLAFFENGYIISAFGEVEEHLIQEIVAELNPLISAYYAHKKDWIVITDFRRWKYITEAAVDLISEFVNNSKHNDNLTRFYLIRQDGLSRYLVDRMLGNEMKEDIVSYDMFDVLKSLNSKKQKLGKTLKTCNFGNLSNVNLDEFFIK